MAKKKKKQEKERLGKVRKGGIKFEGRPLAVMDTGA